MQRVFVVKSMLTGDDGKSPMQREWDRFAASASAYEKEMKMLHEGGSDPFGNDAFREKMRSIRRR